MAACCARGLFFLMGVVICAFMEFMLEFLDRLVGQFQKPALAFLIGGMLIAATGSKLRIPDAIYKFCVFVLLMRIGMKGGMEIREADLTAMALPALFAALTGVTIVLLGSFVLSRLPGLRKDDAIATSGLFGAVSASTLAAAMVLLEEDGVLFEAWVPALYPFMDIPALVLAIVLANLYLNKKQGQAAETVSIGQIVKESLQGSALSALILGMALGLLTKPDPVFESFYNPLFRGLLSILLLAMGIEAYSRLAELRRVAGWYAIYAFCAPIIHGLIAHYTVGFSPGGVVLLAVMASSSSDISGPPTLRAAIPSANPSAYIGSSTSIGTPMAIVIGIPLFIALGELVFAV